MTPDQIPMFAQLDQDHLPPMNERHEVVDLQESVLYLMDKKGLKDSDIVSGARIPWGTWMGWRDGDNMTPRLDHNIWNLWQFLRCPLEFLLFGVGNEDIEVDMDLMTHIKELKRTIKDQKKEIEELKKQVLFYESKSA